MSTDFVGRNVVVTGATGDLGEAVARLLLRAGAKVNAKDNYGSTPLHGAMVMGHLEVVALLREYGAKL